MSNILIYQDKDGLTKIDVRLENETLWITQQQIADLFQTTKQNVSLHINNIYKEGELQESATVKDFLTVQHDWKVKEKTNWKSWKHRWKKQQLKTTITRYKENR